MLGNTKDLPENTKEIQGNTKGNTKEIQGNTKNY